MNSNLLQTVERALDVLNCFVSSKEKLSFTEIMNMTGLSKAVVHRIINTLIYKNYLYKDELDGKYRLGKNVLSLGFISQNNSDIIKNTEIPMLELYNRFNQNTNIYLLTNKKRMCINQKLCSIIQKSSIELGGLYPLEWGAAGNAILAFIENEELLEIYNDIEDRFPGYIKRHNLNSKLDIIRREKVAVQEAADLDGIICVSAPFFGNKGKILGCISVSGPKYIFPEDIDTVKMFVKSYGEEISAKYGNLPIRLVEE